MKEVFADGKEKVRGRVGNEGGGFKLGEAVQAYLRGLAERVRRWLERLDALDATSGGHSWRWRGRREVLYQGLCGRGVELCVGGRWCKSRRRRSCFVRDWNCFGGH